jgi:hypothetical protein
MIIAVIFFSTALFMSDRSIALSDSPSYTILNIWYNSNDKKVLLNNFETTQRTVLHTEITSKNYNNAKLIIKTNNMLLDAHTNGKILYQSNDSKFANYGKCYNIIDISDVSDGGTIYLNLTPKENMVGSISSDIYITTQNDFLMHFISKNIAVILFILAGFIAIAVNGFFIIKRLLKSKNGFSKYIYICILTLLLITIFAAKSNILQFVIGSSEFNYQVLYNAYTLLPIPLLLLSTTITKTKCKTISIFEYIILIYSIFRNILYVTVCAPLSKALFISNFLFAISIVMIIVHFTKTYKKVK